MTPTANPADSIEVANDIDVWSLATDLRCLAGLEIVPCQVLQSVVSPLTCGPMVTRCWRWGQSQESCLECSEGRRSQVPVNKSAIEGLDEGDAAAVVGRLGVCDRVQPIQESPAGVRCAKRSDDVDEGFLMLAKLAGCAFGDLEKALRLVMRDVAALP